MITEIEDKITELLQAATIDDVSTDVVVDIEDILSDSTEFSDYPRIFIAMEEVTALQEQVGGARLQKEYTIGIYLLCFKSDKAELVRQRDVIVDRIETTLRSHKRLDNLVDNNNKESVYNSYITSTRVSKTGVNDSYYSVAWIDFRVDTDRNTLI